MSIRMPRALPDQPPADATATGTPIQGATLDRHARGGLYGAGLAALRELHHDVEHRRDLGDLRLVYPTGSALDVADWWPSKRARFAFVGVHVQAYEDKSSLEDPPKMTIRLVEEITVAAGVDGTSFDVAADDTGAFTIGGYLRVDLGAGDEALGITDIDGDTIKHTAGSRAIVPGDEVRAVIDRGVIFPGWRILQEPVQGVGGAGEQVDHALPRYIFTPETQTPDAGVGSATAPRMLNVRDRQERLLTVEVETNRCRVLGVDVLEGFEALQAEVFE